MPCIDRNLPLSHKQLNGWYLVGRLLDGRLWCEYLPGDERDAEIPDPRSQTPDTFIVELVRNLHNPNHQDSIMSWNSLRAEERGKQRRRRRGRTEGFLASDWLPDFISVEKGRWLGAVCLQRESPRERPKCEAKFEAASSPRLSDSNCPRTRNRCPISPTDKASAIFPSTAPIPPWGSARTRFPISRCPTFNFVVHRIQIKHMANLSGEPFHGPLQLHRYCIRF